MPGNCMIPAVCPIPGTGWSLQPLRLGAWHIFVCLLVHPEVVVLLEAVIASPPFPWLSAVISNYLKNKCVYVLITLQLRDLAPIKWYP